jgi:hypothetical protein
LQEALLCSSKRFRRDGLRQQNWRREREEKSSLGARSPATMGGGVPHEFPWGPVRVPHRRNRNPDAPVRVEDWRRGRRRGCPGLGAGSRLPGAATATPRRLPRRLRRLTAGLHGPPVAEIEGFLCYERADNTTVISAEMESSVRWRAAVGICDVVHGERRRWAAARSLR